QVLQEVPKVVGLELDGLHHAGQRLYPSPPASDLLAHLVGGGEVHTAEYVIPGVPGLRVEQRGRVVQVLHGQVHQVRVVHPEDALVQVVRVQDVLGAQAQAVLEEREVVPVAGAQQDRVHSPGAAVGEVGRVPVQAGEQRDLSDPLRPGESHRGGAVADGHRVGAVLLHLKGEVLSRIAAADDEQVLSGELA